MLDLMRARNVGGCVRRSSPTHALMLRSRSMQRASSGRGLECARASAGSFNVTPPLTVLTTGPLLSVDAQYERLQFVNLELVEDDCVVMGRVL